MKKSHEEKHKEYISKTNSLVVGGNICYNANTTSFSSILQFDMCNTSMGSRIQVIYTKY